MEKRKFDFQKDFIFGQTYERIIAGQLEKLLNMKLDHFNDNNLYDIMMEDLTTYEIKVDRNFKRYNTFFIEFQCNSKPSGINTSESDYYVLTDESLFYVMKTNLLKNLVKINNYAIRCCNNTSYGYIVPLDEIINICWFAGVVN